MNAIISGMEIDGGGCGIDGQLGRFLLTNES